MKKQTMLFVSLGLLWASCSTQHECRPGTLFVRASLDADSGAADQLLVRVHRDGHDDVDLAPFTRALAGAAVESFEIAFGSYQAGASVTLDVTAVAHGVVVGETTKTIALAPGCTAADVSIGGLGVTPPDDMAGGDGSDLGMGDVADLAMPADLTPPRIDDLAMAQGAPGAPGNVSATPFPGRVVRLTWDAPTDSGTGAITGYTVESSPPGFSMTTAMRTIDTSALGVGTTYTFKVYASNAAGLGSPGTSNAVIAGDVPTAPTNVHATAQGLAATIDWAASVANGYPVLDYTVAADTGGLKVVVDGSKTTAMLTGLANGQAYHFTVTPRNALGTGSASSASNAITGSCTNTSYSMYAADTTTVQYVGDANASAISYIEARHDVRPPPFVNRDTTGWALFHLPDPPNGPPATASVVAVQLTMNVSTTISNPAPTLVEVWYSQDDGWRSSQVLTSADVRRTQKVSHSPQPPGAAGGKLVVDLDVLPTTGAWDWSKDLTDRYITVGVTDADLTDQLSYMRFLDASAGATSVPLLKLTVCQ